MFYLVPPAGTPIKYSEILKIMKTRLLSGSDCERFVEKIKSHANVRHCFFFNSGRTALAYILRSISKSSEKNEVIIPAYTCYSVAAAIARSGLKIRLIDIDPETMDYNYRALENTDFKNVLAIIACNLFGILSNWSSLISVAGKRDVYLIDDAAQSMGSPFQNKVSGSMGDAGFYSLDRGKNLSTLAGGVLLTDNDEIASFASENTRQFNDHKLAHEFMAIVKFLLYGFFIRPSLYWIPNNLPFLGLGKTIFDETFKIGSLPKIQKCAGDLLFSKLDSFNSIRVKNATLLADAIAEKGTFTIPGYSKSRCPVYLRLPLLTKDESSRDRTIKELRKSGIAASVMYPSAISGIKGIDKYLTVPKADFPVADDIAGRLLTLPTHPLLSDKDLERIKESLARI